MVIFEICLCTSLEWRGRCSSCKRSATACQNEVIVWFNVYTDPYMLSCTQSSLQIPMCSCIHRSCTGIPIVLIQTAPSIIGYSKTELMATPPTNWSGCALKKMQLGASDRSLCTLIHISSLVHWSLCALAYTDPSALLQESLLCFLVHRSLCTLIPISSLVHWSLYALLYTILFTQIPMCSCIHGSLLFVQESLLCFLVHRSLCTLIPCSLVHTILLY